MTASKGSSARSHSKDVVFWKNDGEHIVLTSPTHLPKATTFLWNPRLLLQVNCRGYVMSQHLSPQTAKYSYAPNLEAKTFLQPEQPYFAHYPGRFFYVKNEDTGDIYSLPYEPVRRSFDKFEFIAGMSDVQWHIEKDGLIFQLTLTIPRDDVVEIWEFSVKNKTSEAVNISVYPSFTIGFMSWMNQSAAYDPNLGAIIARCVTPYQKLEDYEGVKNLKDITFLLHDTKPSGWETIREIFEGEGGIQNPDGVSRNRLLNNESNYETPTATLQYCMQLEPGADKNLNLLFGPAHSKRDVEALRNRYFSTAKIKQAKSKMNERMARCKESLQIDTPDDEFNNFVNRWLPRQIYYHGDTNRMTDDPQTRNYLQDNLGMVYLNPDISKKSILTALSQQNTDGSMPDGILLSANAKLQYINQIPHTDHCIWLPICIEVYLDETGDYSLLAEIVTDVTEGQKATVFERVSRALEWLASNRDQRGLSFINQGDWCDPMNMVGPKGKGVSGWLTIATIYALKVWSKISLEFDHSRQAKDLLAQADEISDAVHKHLWDGNWFARGISDDGTIFGIHSDAEGKIFLNPQSWAMLADILSDAQLNTLTSAIYENLDTPYGLTLLAPAYTKMHEHIGRVTQKFPGSAENGSVYNHAAIFYIYALFQRNEGDLAYEHLRKMLPGLNAKDLTRRGQLPVFIPNYYRGAHKQFPDTSGRSSHLFNTGTVSWYYRCVLEGLFGAKGCKDGIVFEPNLPSKWNKASITRKFRGATFNIKYERARNSRVIIDGDEIHGVFTSIETGKDYEVVVYFT